MRSERKTTSSRIQPGLLDIGALARSEVERFTELAVSRNIELSYEGPEYGLAVIAKHHLLRELISSLLDNAIRYDFNGEFVTLSLKERLVRFHVEDDGPGITESERMLVLERFYRLPNHEHEGCGLGLSIASEIATQYGATLTIKANRKRFGIVIEVLFSASQT